MMTYWALRQIQIFSCINSFFHNILDLLSFPFYLALALKSILIEKREVKSYQGNNEFNNTHLDMRIMIKLFNNIKEREIIVIKLNYNCHVNT